MAEVLPYICALSQETTPRNTSECDGARTRTLLAQRSPSPPRPSSIETPAVAQSSYVARWREEAKPRKRASLVPAPAGACEASSRELLFRWLQMCIRLSWQVFVCASLHVHRELLAPLLATQFRSPHTATLFFWVSGTPAQTNTDFLPLKLGHTRAHARTYGCRMTGVFPFAHQGRCDVNKDMTSNCESRTVGRKTVSRTILQLRAARPLSNTEFALVFGHKCCQRRVLYTLS